MASLLNQQDILNMDRRKRAALIQSVSGFKSLQLIGTIDPKGQTNLAVVSSVMHLGSNPALLGWLSRPDTVERHTLSNIMETGFFTINHVHSGIYRQAHQTSAKYPRDVSEFAACRLTEQYIDGFSAPFVQESRIKIGLRLEQRVDLSVNGTILIIGSIQLLAFPQECCGEDGYLDIEKADTITCSGPDSYHQTRRLERLAYARPEAPTRSLPFPFKD